MNNQPNVLLFSVILGAVFLLLDVYVLGHWTAYVRRKGMNPGWHRSMWIVAAVMITLYVVAVSRRNFFRLDGLDVVLLGISTFWYLPKLGIAPVLFVRDIMRGFARLFRPVSPSVGARQKIIPSVVEGLTPPAAPSLRTPPGRFLPCPT
ncbi:MAG: hypothetical protein IPM83_08545 [Ignavibacteria bacterium]|nr:hypothetical protein [Ignavibacteria bacterium]